MTYNHIYNGSCHCGNISFEFSTNKSIEEFAPRICSCSFCLRHGGRYISDPDGRLEISCKDNAQLNRYQFGHKTADFILCKNCGVFIGAICTIDERDYAVINIKTMLNYDFSDNATSNDYDSENQGSRLERRAKNWIPHVALNGF